MVRKSFASAMPPPKKIRQIDGQQKLDFCRNKITTTGRPTYFTTTARRSTVAVWLWDRQYLYRPKYY